MATTTIAPPHTSSQARHLRAFIFDMDGVVTDTAEVHAAAWKELFDGILARLAPDQLPFDPEHDYRTYVDGRPREDGVRAFLKSRRIGLPEGRPEDPPDQMTVHGLAARKQNLFTERLKTSGVMAFADAVQALAHLKSRAIPTALVTASRNSREVLDAASLSEMFTIRVDATDAELLSLPGKPSPETFLEAARRLGVEPANAVVLEDAVAGVQAAVRGGFGLVIGVDRGGHGADLAASGAHVVLDDLYQLESVIPDGWLAEHGIWGAGADETFSNSWELVFDGFDPYLEGTREALCTMGNGYWATRGAMPGSTCDGVNYPGTYLAGVYNRLISTRDGENVETEHMVNAPDWAFVTVRIAGGPHLFPGCAEALSHWQCLDLRTGVLSRIDRYRDDRGRTTKVSLQQLVSVSQPHLAGLQLTVTAEDWTGELTVESAVNANVANRNVAADHQLAHRHLLMVGSTALDDDTVLNEVRTSQSRIDIAMSIRNRIESDGTVTDRRLITRPDRAGHKYSVRVEPGRSLTLEKIAVVATSRDRAMSTAALSAQNRICQAPGFEDLVAAQRQMWADLWQQFGISLPAADCEHILALNLHIFHVLQTVIAADTDLDAGLPARGLHGEGYRGHIFWDELYIYPMLTLRRPELTRSFLLYRYRRLTAAKATARAHGFDGAMFPWQSGSDGREETPTALFNVHNGQWMPDNSHRQYHVGLAVAYSVWQYYQVTEDIGFLADYGAEMLVEVARLFTSMAVYNPVDDRYDIGGVMGPDEYHDGYPDRPGHGLRNNAYTNVMAAWVLARAQDALQLIGQCDCVLSRRGLNVKSGERERWDRISCRLRIPFHDGVISQFEGYGELREFDWEGYRRRYGNIGRLDLILQAEGDSTNNYRLSKQADVLMLFYLLSAEELRSVFERLDYELPPELIPRTVDYYLARTSHGSTLSRLIHSWVLARTNRARSWSMFTEALKADLDDTQGGTTREGVHLGAMAGTADMVIRCYGGVETREDVLRLHPVLPTELAAASFRILYRGQPLAIKLTQHRVELQLLPCSAQPIRLCLEGIERTLHPGQTWEMDLPAAPPTKKRSPPYDEPSPP